MILSVVVLTIVISAEHNYGHEDDISSENEKLRNEITLQGYFLWNGRIRFTKFIEEIKNWFYSNIKILEKLLGSKCLFDDLHYAYDYAVIVLAISDLPEFVVPCTRDCRLKKYLWYDFLKLIVPPSIEEHVFVRKINNYSRVADLWFLPVWDHIKAILKHYSRTRHRLIKTISDFRFHRWLT